MRGKKILFLFFIICLSFLLSIPASADMGPKPKLTVIVRNPPEGEYYLDLLVNYDLPLCKNLTEYKESLDQEKLSILEEYKQNGWYSALVHGTRLKLWGKLTGEKTDGVMKHTFGYFGTPDEYKIIIITPDHKIITTRLIEKKSYVSTVYYDYKTGEITEAHGLTLALTYGRQFLMSLLPTLILESIVLLLFRFRTAHTLKVFFFTNVFTQILLTVTMSTLLLLFGIYACCVLLYAAEIIVTVIEALIYTFRLREGTKRKRVAYAITANIVSSLAMFPLMYLEYLLFIY